MSVAHSRIVLTTLAVCCCIAAPARAQHHAANGFATGIAHTDLHLEQYVTLDTAGVALVQNTGAAPITVDSIVPIGSDADTYVFMQTKPTPNVIPPYGVDTFFITFKPNASPAQPLSTGRRSYMVQYAVYNNSGTIDTVTFTGRGYMVDVHTHIARSYLTQAGMAVAPVSVVVDTVRDTLGLENIRGCICEIIHYRRTVVQPDESYNVGDYTSNGRFTSGSIGTNTEGAQFAMNRAETDMKDSGHNIGFQGYYEFNIGFSPRNMFRTGTLFNLRFLTFAPGWVDSSGGIHPRPWHTSDHILPYPIAADGIHWLETPTDTSEIVYFIKNPIDAGNNLVNYCNITSDPGLISVGSVPRTVSVDLYPTSTHTVSMMRFGLTEPMDVAIDVYDEAGNRVAAPVHQGFNEGTYEFPIRMSALPQGMYFVWFRAGGNVGYAAVFRE